MKSSFIHLCEYIDMTSKLIQRSRRCMHVPVESYSRAGTEDWARHGPRSSVKLHPLASRVNACSTGAQEEGCYAGRKEKLSGLIPVWTWRSITRRQQQHPRQCLAVLARIHGTSFLLNECSCCLPLRSMPSLWWNATYQLCKNLWKRAIMCV